MLLQALTLTALLQYNKLRKYRSQVTALDAELAEHREQSASAKSRYADWTKELQEKLKAMREEKKKLTAEVTSLRSSEENLKVNASQHEL